MKNKQLQKKAKYTLDLLRLINKSCDCNNCKNEEYISMIDFAVACMVRELVAEMVSKEVGVDVMVGRNILYALLKEEQEIEGNIKCWFENIM